ncbi:MAG: helix-turn-helix domain-containing protein [Candidatus Latescibacteria bacterium]|nr:helix-turn-helix domain-containing protein [bacterium]MBD3423784.1 helix-turn-helix domain-containing protein [Candidatus Latescibacterota bacterium]
MACFQVSKIPALLPKSCLVLLAAFWPLFPSDACGRGRQEGPVIDTPAISRDLPARRVNVILKARSGYLYLGTPAGLVRTDGSSAEPVSADIYPEISEGRILSLHQDEEGRIWIGTGGAGLFILSGGRLERFHGQDLLFNKYIRAVTSSTGGNIWIGTEFGLYRLHEGQIKSFGLDEGLPDNLITALAADSAGNVWAGMMQGGVAEISGGQVLAYGPGEGLTSPEVLSLAAEEEGILWIGTMDGLFVKGAGESIIRPLPLTSPVTSLEITGRRIIAGTMTDGIFIIEPEGEDRYHFRNITGNGNVSATLSTGDNLMWASTEQEGLVWIRKREAGRIDMPGGEIYPILAAEGSLLAGTGNQGLIRIVEGRWERVAGKENGISMVRALYREGPSRIWIGTRDNGLHFMDRGSINKMNGLPSDNITSITRHGGKIWAGTLRGLAALQGRGTGVITVLKGIRINTLYREGDTSFLAGTGRGIWRLNGAGNAGKLDAGDPAPDVLSLYRESGGTLWIGTNGSGLKRLIEEELATFDTGDGLPGNFIYSIHGVEPGIIWASCENGVFRISADSLNAYAAGKSPVLTPTLYDRSTGMPSSGCNGYCSPAYAVSAEGELLYPTVEGIAVIKPAPLKYRPPRVIIEGVASRAMRYNGTGTPSFSSDSGPVSIDFTVLDYPFPEKLYFLYKLDRFDRGWNPVNPGGGRTAIYRELTPGDYSFRVWAIGRGSRWSPEPAVIHFSISPPLYLRPEFMAAAAALLILGASVVYAFIVLRRRKRERSKYSTTRVDRERRAEALTELRSLIKQEKIFLDPDLTLGKLARRLRIHSNYLSRIINEEMGVNYNDYINRFRVREACRILRSPGSDGMNITEVMYQAGFYSKSTFNTAFRKVTGTTPSRYRVNSR